MTLHRRTLFVTAAAGLGMPILARAQGAGASAEQTAAWKTERAIGSPQAKIRVEEWFSLTCTHCARFAQDTFPRVRKDLVDTNRVRWVFKDFPLDRVALQAAMVARALPPDRYESFILALFASQDRWAFAKDVDYARELWNMAALAGMNRSTFEAASTDTALQDWIIAQQNEAEKKYQIDATPSFVINGKKYSGEMSYGDFVKLLPDVS
jgi:protein-disulfide isomerase